MCFFTVNHIYPAIIVSDDDIRDVLPSYALTCDIPIQLFTVVVNAPSKDQETPTEY